MVVSKMNENKGKILLRPYVCYDMRLTSHKSWITSWSQGNFCSTSLVAAINCSLWAYYGLFQKERYSNLLQPRTRDHLWFDHSHHSLVINERERDPKSVIVRNSIFVVLTSHSWDRGYKADEISAVEPAQPLRLCSTIQKILRGQDFCPSLFLMEWIHFHGIMGGLFIEKIKGDKSGSKHHCQVLWAVQQHLVLSRSSNIYKETGNTSS